MGIFNSYVKLPEGISFVCTNLANDLGPHLAAAGTGHGRIGLKESEAKVLALQKRGTTVVLGVTGVTNTVGDFFVSTMKNTYVFHVA